MIEQERIEHVVRSMQAMRIWRGCGGSTFGPHVEHVSMELENFKGFVRSIITAALEADAPALAAAEARGKVEEATRMRDEFATLRKFVTPIGAVKQFAQNLEYRIAALQSSQDKTGSEG